MSLSMSITLCLVWAAVLLHSPFFNGAADKQTAPSNTKRTCSKSDLTDGCVIYSPNNPASSCGKACYNNHNVSSATQTQSSQPHHSLSTHYNYTNVYSSQHKNVPKEIRSVHTSTHGVISYEVEWNDGVATSTTKESRRFFDRYPEYQEYLLSGNEVNKDRVSIVQQHMYQ